MKYYGYVHCQECERTEIENFIVENGGEVVHGLREKWIRFIAQVSPLMRMRLGFITYSTIVFKTNSCFKIRHILHESIEKFGGFSLDEREL